MKEHRRELIVQVDLFLVSYMYSDRIIILNFNTAFSSISNWKKKVLLVMLILGRLVENLWYAMGSSSSRNNSLMSIFSLFFHVLYFKFSLVWSLKWVWKDVVKGKPQIKKTSLIVHIVCQFFFCCFFFHVEIYGQRNISGDSSKKVVPCKGDRNCPWYWV